MILWIIGLSGSGKTTLAEQVVKMVRSRGQKIVLVDGDRVRELFGNDLGHDLDGRKKNADRICSLCQFLDEQGINVVCAILSIFPETREWCRQNLSNYFEVFIDAPIDDLVKRDSKGIYKKYLNGEINNVAGFDLEFPMPDSSDLVISNTGALATFLSNAEYIADRLSENK